jgi:hypothetical protein
MIKLGSVLEAAEHIGCDANHVYYLINIGTLYAFKVRWIYRIDMTTVEDYATRRPGREIAERATRYSGCPGYLFDLASFAEDNNARDQRGQNNRISSGRGMERESSGLSSLPQPQRKPVAATPRPVQFELAIA